MKSRKLGHTKKIKPMNSKGRDSESSQVSEPIRIGITGSPGTGKKTLGELLSKILQEEFVSINDYAIRQGYGRNRTMTIS